MGKRILQAESLLRLMSVVLAALTACIVGFNKQTKEVFFSVERTATVKDLSALWILTVVASAVAGYQFIRLVCKCFYLGRSEGADDLCSKPCGWACLLLDQGVMYTMFGATAAGAQASMIAVTGVKALQWTKACNIYTRFCQQIGGGLFCALMASLAMCVVSYVSAYRFFCKHYAVKRAHVPPSFTT